jgi:hypothetical protein
MTPTQLNTPPPPPKPHIAYVYLGRGGGGWGGEPERRLEGQELTKLGQTTNIADCIFSL